MRYLTNWILNSLVILAVAHLLPGFSVDDFGTAMMVSLVLGVLTAILGPLLQFFGVLLTLPAVLLTFGLFYFVIRVIVSLLLLKMTAALVPGFHIVGPGPLILGAILISVFQHIASALLLPPADDRSK